MRIYLSICLFSLTFTASHHSTADELGGGAVEQSVRPQVRPRRDPIGDLLREVIKEDSGMPSSPRPMIRPLRVNELDFSSQPPFPFPSEHEKCNSEYITSDSRYGPGAQELIERFRSMSRGNNVRGEPDPRHFDRMFKNQSRNIGQSCPRYNSMSPNERMHFWLWAFTSIAEVESDCGNNAVNLEDVNGVSMCDFQMPENERVNGPNARSPSWRGPGCDIENDGRPAVQEFRLGELTNTRFEMANPSTCAACAVEVMGKVLCGFHSVDGVNCYDPPIRKLFGGHSFWKQMKNDNGMIMDKLKKYPGCK